ncbi:MAG: YncE family protein [Chitinispirillaceae bacterium]|nr:YncE family protein [Chitinispirillaceae bacterium]
MHKIVNKICTTYKTVVTKYFFITFAVMVLFQILLANNNERSIVSPALVYELLALNGDLESLQKPKYLSPSAMILSPDKKHIYICEQTAKKVDLYSVSSNNVVRSIQLPNEPTGIAVSSDGSHLYVTCASERWPNGMVCVINNADGIIKKRIPVGHMARSPILNSDNSMLYVCNWLENTISFIDLSAQKEIKRVAAIKEPYSLALTTDNASLLVANMIPDGISTDTTMTCKVCFINTSSGEIEKIIRLPDGSHSTMNICLSPEKKYAFIPHLIGRVNLPAVTLEQGWVHSNNLAIVDMEKKALFNDIELDDNIHGFANPWSAACTDNSKWLCVIHAGYDIITIIDMPSMFKKLEGKGDVSHDFSFIRDLKKTVIAQARSPRSIVTAGSKVYFTGYFSQSINMIDLEDSSISVTKYPLAGEEKKLTAERKGESYFYDANLCVGHWQSCHSCHPFTRPDGLNWILSDSYLSSPKNAKSMLFTFQTPPANWGCKRDNAYESVRSGIRLELQVEPDAQTSIALDTFLMRLKPVPSPKLVKGRLSESALKGKEIYYDADKLDCVHCHPAPLFTNLRKANAGTFDDYDPSFDWDTPSLIECWRTGPYNHIGSHETVEINLRQTGHSRNVNNLSKEEFDHLVQYILSL